MQDADLSEMAQDTKFGIVLRQVMNSLYHDIKPKKWRQEH